MTATIQSMAENIMRNLAKHGFPGNSVSLPLERLYESAHRDGVNFNKVLEHLDAQGIGHEKTTEKIIFNLKSSMQDLMTKAQEMMKNMTPDQLAAVKKMVENMSPEEREQMMKMAQSMGGI